MPKLLWADHQPNILLLNSYHPQYSWTAELTLGVQQTLAEQLPLENLHIEYMDQRRFIDDPDYHQKLVELYQYKYGNRQPDVIITSDDAAYQFMLAHGEQLFTDVPVIFSGVNIFEPQQLQGRDNFSGIEEGEAIKANLDLIAKVQPKLERIIILGDNTGLGLRLYQKALTIKQLWLENPANSHIKVEVYNQFNKRELTHITTNLDTRSAILLLAIHKDSNGEYFSYDKDVPKLAAKTQAPIYGMWGSLLIDKGVLGGMMNNPYLHGQNAAKMALKIKHEPPTAPSAQVAPVIAQAQYLPTFNYRQLQRFDIDMDLLPQDAEIIGKPQSIYTTYATLVNSALATLISLAVIIMILAFNLIQRRDSQQKLKKLNQKLEHLVDVRTKDLADKNQALEQAKAELESLATTDCLTELGNRRSGNEQLHRYIKRISFQYQPIALALVDLDHFKKINDSYGHHVGDEVLTAVAKTFIEHIRPDDRVYRWGGEEFIIILPNATIDEAFEVCERLRHYVEQIKVEPVEQITASIGLTCLTDNDDHDQLLQIVDQAMYQAKRTGRNKTCIERRGLIEVE